MPALLLSETIEAFKVVLMSGVFPPMKVDVFANETELAVGSLVMMLMIPPIALEPKSADPPPRTTSTRSIIFVGICSMP